jgi:hypothetical protein
MELLLILMVPAIILAAAAVGARIVYLLPIMPAA